MDGFLLDVTYEPPAGARDVGKAVLWFRSDDGRTHRVAEPFAPLVYARARDRAALAELEALAPLLPGAATPFRTHARCGLADELEEVLAVPVRDARRLRDLVQSLDERGGFRDYEIFDADLRLSHRWLVEKGLFPFCRMRANAPGRYRLLDDQWATDYAPPPLRELRLDARPDCPRGEIPGEGTRLREVRLDERVLDDPDEKRLLLALQAELDARDPDLILTRGGDTFLVPYLHARAAAHGLELQLGRARAPAGPRSRGKSFFTYGKIKWRAPAWALNGRIHLDASTSFFYVEAGLAGLLDLCRVARSPLQEMARLGAGTAVTAIQIDLAKREGRLIPWKKNAPESFKTARDLLRADRGGYIREPDVGLHQDVVELDFASMYPNIMVHRNISPEVILCPCCRDEPAGEVPQLGFWTCRRREGFIPRALRPVVARREHFKRMRKADPEHRKAHQERVDVYKWLLVTSFGYQGYKNAKFGRIECHEAIGAWGREILLRAGEVAREVGFEPVHGIVDSLWLERTKPGGLPTEALGKELSALVKEEIGIPFEYEGRYKWIVFLPNRQDALGPHAPAVGALNRYYGCFDRAPEKPNRSQPGQPLDTIAGGIVKARGVELRQHSTPTLLRDAQRRVLEELAKADDAEQFLARLPTALDAVVPLLDKLREGAVPLEDLVVTASVAQRMEDYRANTLPHAALKQLARAGVAVEPGQSVRFVVTDHDARDHARRVVESRLMRGDERYDAGWYEGLVLRAVASLALPFGWDEASLAVRYGGTVQRRLVEFA